MSVGLGLLQRLLRDGRSITTLADQEVTEEMFYENELDVYHFIEEHQRAYGQVPRIATVERETGISFGKFTDEPMGYWIDNVVDRWKTKVIIDASQNMREHANSARLADARQTARDLVIKLDMGHEHDRIVTLEEASQEVITSHDTRQRQSRMSGVPFGIPYLDRMSDGAQPEDTVAIVGRPSVGKTYILLSMILSAYLTGEIPLVVSLEMSVKQCARRLMALYSNISAKLIRLGRLSYFARSKLVTDLDQLIAMTGRALHFLQGSLISTVEDLAFRVQEIRPTVLYVDGAYLLRTKSRTAARWERTAETAEVLKMIARNAHIPVIATYQFNKRGLGLDNIAFSDTIAQLASIVCGIQNEDESEQRDERWEAVTHKLFHILKGREGEKGVVRLLYDMEHTNIRQEEVISGYLTHNDEEDDVEVGNGRRN